jgi:hypothetical protein
VIDAIGLEHERPHRIPVGDPVPRRACHCSRARDCFVRQRMLDRAEQRQEQGRGHEERPGREDGAGLLEEEAQVDERTVSEGDPLSELGPQPIGGGRVVHVRAHQRGRALLHEHRARRGPQQLLLVAEGEVHRH